MSRAAASRRWGAKAQIWGWAALAALLLAAAIAAGTVVGETAIHPLVAGQAIANKLFGGSYPLSPIQEGIIWNYRLTRSIVAASCGATLAVSGLVLQSLLRNALADPYLLGLSAGASTGAVSVTILGLGAGVVSLSAGAFAGAVAAFALVIVLARAAGGGASMTGAAIIILAGIAGSQLFSALTSFIVTRSANAEEVRGIMFWLLGNLSGVRWDDVRLAVPAAVIGVLVCIWHRRALDAFTFGVESAASLGIPVRRVQIVLIGTTAFMTASMVSIVGSIGFVGLVVPHAARMLVGVRHTRLLPVCAVLGGVFLVMADILSRVAIPGQVLPIGVITALVGAPGFAVILVRKGRRS